jgi:hypothetical protein
MKKLTLSVRSRRISTLNNKAFLHRSVGFFATQSPQQPTGSKPKVSGDNHLGIICKDAVVLAKPPAVSGKPIGKRLQNAKWDKIKRKMVVGALSFHDKVCPHVPSSCEQGANGPFPDRSQELR